LREEFYDPSKVALVPMGFCYPGAGDGGDLPPRPECAPLWHRRALGVLPDDRLSLLVGGYAQAAYLDGARRRTMTETVRGFADHDRSVFPLPHPSWRSGPWMKKNPWFEAEAAPALRSRVRERLAS
jgi:uracil-DNA glycosylase